MLHEAKSAHDYVDEWTSRGPATYLEGMALFGPVTHAKRLVPVLAACGYLDLVKPRGNNRQKKQVGVGIIPIQRLPNQSVVLEDRRGPLSRCSIRHEGSNRL